MHEFADAVATSADYLHIGIAPGLSRDESNGHSISLDGRSPHGLRGETVDFDEVAHDSQGLTGGGLAGGGAAFGITRGNDEVYAEGGLPAQGGGGQCRETRVAVGRETGGFDVRREGPSVGCGG